MDKHTLSNYGWIIILTLVMGVMLAIASPFGNYVGDGIVNIANAYGIVNEDAVNVSNVESMSDEWEGKFHEWGSGSENNTDPAKNLNHSGIIPEGGKYLQQVDWCQNCWVKYGTVDENCDCGFVFQTGKTFKSGDAFPDVQTGDMYYYGDYLYAYKLAPCFSHGGPYGGCGCYSSDGWIVITTDKTKSAYGSILNTINNCPIRSVDDLFYNCSNLITSPSIPLTVSQMGRTFENCTSLIKAPEIKNHTELTGLSNTFWGCTSLAEMPELPVSIKGLYAAFYGCTSLTTIYVPNHITDLDFAFASCTSLTGKIEINANCTWIYGAFSEVDFQTQQITFIGSSTTLDEIGQTGISYCNECNGYCSC